MGHWEGREGQEVRRGVRQQFGHLGKGLPELFHHSVQLAVDLGRRQLLVDGADHARRSWVATPGWARLGTRVSKVGHEVGAAALPVGPSKHHGDGVLQPLVSIGGNQFNAAGAHVHVQGLTLPFGIDPRSHHHADVDGRATHVAHFTAALYTPNYEYLQLDKKESKSFPLLWYKLSLRH